jgi:hypothetical protein
VTAAAAAAAATTATPAVTNFCFEVSIIFIVMLYQLLKCNQLRINI